MANSPAQSLLALLETDVLTQFGNPLLTFLTAVQAANGDPLKVTAAWVQLQGNFVAATPALVGGFEAQLAAALAAKIVAAQTSVAAKAA